MRSMLQTLLFLQGTAIRQMAQRVQQQQPVTAALRKLQRTGGLDPQQLPSSQKPMGMHSRAQRLHSRRMRSCSSPQMQVRMHPDIWLNTMFEMQAVTHWLHQVLSATSARC